MARENAPSHSASSGSGTNNSFSNCILKVQPYDAQFYSTNNCILYYNAADSSSSSVAYNSIGINTDSTANYFTSSILGGQGLHNFNSMSDVFRTFRGTYDGTPIFELNDSIASSILGTDGTQVGVYGGGAPFNPSVRNTLIGRLSVGRHTNAQGKLEVGVEIISTDNSTTVDSSNSSGVGSNLNQ